ncbi:MAG: 5-formyltetrahydrofolate cyclo-ligase [Treponema sp.]|nr:5-formyltetrahydrofolate cyclo-ligase [Treponema sp.]
MEQKGFYRQKINKLFRESSLSQSYKDESEKRVYEAVISSKEYRESEFIFLYMARKDELSVASIINESFKLGKKVLLPRIIPNTNRMDFYFVKPEDFDEKVQIGSYEILEPDDTNEKLIISSIKEKSYIIIPGRCFTKNGKRLGRGKGFYDVFLKQMKMNTKCFLCGVCYDFQIEEDFPTDENDINMDLVLC